MIYSKTEAEYIQYVKKVLNKLRRAGLFLKPEKYEFHKVELVFLGFVVRKNSIKIDLVKIKTVLSWSISGIVKETQAFLRFANFYRRFIYNYSKVA